MSLTLLILLLQTMVYLSLYRLATDWDGMASAVGAYAAQSRGAFSPLAPAGWYLNKSAHTLLAMGKLGNYNGVGLMAASVTFAGVLDALAQEAAADPNSPYGWPALFTACDGLQRSRTQQFISTPFPYGSEMPWDSTVGYFCAMAIKLIISPVLKGAITHVYLAPLDLFLLLQGQEEIFRFTTRYAADYAPGSYRTSNLTLAAVKAYTPWDTPLWAYHGSSRRCE